MNPRKIVRAVLVKNKGLVVFSLCLTLIQSLLAILLPYLGKREIEIFEGKSSWLPFFHSPAGMFFFFIGAIFLAKGLGTLCGGGERFLDTLARERMAMEMDRHLYKKMETLDAGFLENPKNRRLIFIFFDMGQLPWSVLRFVRTSLGMSLALAGIIPIVALTSLKVLAIVLSFGVIQFMLTRSKMKRENAYRLFKEKALAGTHELMFLLRYHFHQLLSVSGEKQIMPRYFHRRREAVTMEVKEESIKISYALLYSLTENFTLLLTAAFMGLAVLAGEISIGTFTMITLYAVTLQSAISELNQKMSDWYHLRTVMVQLGFFLSMKSRIDETLIDPQAKGEPGEIRLENITFSYPGLMDEERAYISHLVKELNLAGKNREMWSADWELVKEWERLMEDKSREKTILKGLSHTFPAGSITAVVGKNGSGKTTLT
ncbi:ABC transporter ATP-binding protein/permease, partial [Myxococcota bacterium]|nr:ABC transporter ATP-binding protein/permease [Myxococcota bacterium]